MKEEFVQFVWKHGMFSDTNLKTREGQKIEIIDRGILNRDEGPDFFNARIKVDETVWAGNVEIHKRASDWKRHHHK